VGFAPPLIRNCGSHLLKANKKLFQVLKPPLKSCTLGPTEGDLFKAYFNQGYTGSNQP
jgi:hypothetical protein